MDDFQVKNRMQLLGKARVQDLVPIILQAYVAEMRKRATRLLAPRYGFYVHAGVGHRTWHGCRHALMLMSGCNLKTVDCFMSPSYRLVFGL